MSEHFISRSDAETDLLACATYIAESIVGGEARGEAIATVVPHYLGLGNVDLAAQLADTVDDPFTRDRLLIGVAEKCAELDDDEYAIQLAEAIEEPGFQAQAFERIGSVKASKGEFDKARAVAALMVHPDSVLAGIAVKQSANGDIGSSVNTIEEIEFPSAAVSALNTIAVSEIKGENADAAGPILERSLARAGEIEHDEERIRTICEIGNLFLDAGQKSRAVETFEKARVEAEDVDNIHRDALLAQVSLGFLNSGSIDLADRALDAVSDKTQIASVLLGFARHYWRREEKDDAHEALDEAYEILRSQSGTETRDSKAKFALTGSIAAQFAGFGKGERAMEVAESIEDEDQRSAALTQVAVIFSAQGEDSLTRHALGSIREASTRVVALINMSDAVRETDAERAGRLLDEAEELTGEVSQFSLKVDALIAIADRTGDERLEKLRSTVSRVIDTVANMRSDRGRVKALAQLSGITERADLKLTDNETKSLRAFIGLETFG